MVTIVVHLLSHVRLFATLWTAARQASLSLAIFQSLFRFIVHWVSDAIQPSHPLLPPSPSALNLSQHQAFFNVLALHIRWWKYWSFSISPSNEYSGLISFRIDWFDLLAVQGTLKESSPSPPFENINSLVLSLLYGPPLSLIHSSSETLLYKWARVPYCVGIECSFTMLCWVVDNCKAQDNKYFRLCRPDSICCNFSTWCCSKKQRGKYLNAWV